MADVHTTNWDRPRPDFNSLRQWSGSSSLLRTVQGPGKTLEPSHYRAERTCDPGEAKPSSFFQPISVYVFILTEEYNHRWASM